MTRADKQSAEDGKLLAMVSHFFILGTIISWILNLNKQNSFVSFYNRQMIGWHLLIFLNGWLIYAFFGGFIKFIIWGVLIFLWITSLFGAMKEKETLIPVFGAYFQKIFRSL